MRRAIVAVGITVALEGCHWRVPDLDCRVLGCPAGQECKKERDDDDAPGAGQKWGCFPTPSPTPTPTPTPTPPPAPTPTPTPTPSPTPTPPTPPGAFPVRFPLPSAALYMRNHRYGNGIDATVRVSGDRALCEALHHVPVPSGDCHFDSNVWSPGQRVDYEGLVLAGARSGQPPPAAPLGPVWQYRAGGQYGRCHDDQTRANTSCDHFGDTINRDDPQTRDVFEGTPAWLAAQRDEFGPYAGFFTIPQTSGPEFGTLVRACLPLAEGDEATCAPWITVDWK